MILLNAFHGFLCYLLMTDTSMYRTHSHKCFLCSFSVIPVGYSFYARLYPVACKNAPHNITRLSFWQRDCMCYMNVGKMRKHKKWRVNPAHLSVHGALRCPLMLKQSICLSIILTIGALGGAGFQSFEVNLSWEICITGAQCNHRLKINCLRCTTSNRL